jgi:DTW domain-containing protein YfiP
LRQWKIFERITILETFIPPPVDPAQAPINIRVTRTALDRVFQVLKSTVEYPVVVIIDDTWKKAWRAAGSMAPTLPTICVKMTMLDIIIKPRYHHTSSIS